LIGVWTDSYKNPPSPAINPETQLGLRESGKTKPGLVGCGATPTMPGKVFETRAGGSQRRPY